jgi:Ni,Fe-hydrogenase III large subunit
VVRLEARLGYVHKGIEGLMTGAGLDRAAKLAARTSGDSTVAYGFAFARAAEAALGIEPPPRAVWLRALMAEIERLANHLGDIGAICNDAAFAHPPSATQPARRRPTSHAALSCFLPSSFFIPRPHPPDGLCRDFGRWIWSSLHPVCL